MDWDTTTPAAPRHAQLHGQRRAVQLDRRARRSAAAVALVGRARSTGSPRDEFFSPFVRGHRRHADQQPEPALARRRRPTAARVLLIYDDDNHGTRLRPAFELGVGTTIAAGPAYQLRWEIRDNIVGIQRSPARRLHRRPVPPHETVYKHLFSMTDRPRRGARARSAGDATERTAASGARSWPAAAPPGSAAGPKAWSRSAGSGSSTGWWP